MCDGNFRNKMDIIRDLLRIDHPAEPHEYTMEHLVWDIEELEKYRAVRTGSNPDNRIQSVRTTGT